MLNRSPWPIILIFLILGATVFNLSWSADRVIRKAVVVTRLSGQPFCDQKVTYELADPNSYVIFDAADIFTHDVDCVINHDGDMFRVIGQQHTDFSAGLAMIGFDFLLLTAALSTPGQKNKYYPWLPYNTAFYVPQVVIFLINLAHYFHVLI